MPDETVLEEEHLEAVFASQAPDLEQPLEGAGWRLAKSLQTLRAECNKKAPKRSRANDGTIGDTNHANRPSRHNPNNAGVVCALDITHDPANGMDTYAMFDYIRKHPQVDCEYVISNRRIASRSRNWESRPYTGASPHSEHIHIAVGRGPEREPYGPYDDTNPWGIASTTPVDDFPYGKRTLQLTSPYMQGMDALWVAQQMNKLKCYPPNVTQHLKETETYNKEVANCVKVFQKRYSIKADGIVGRVTWDTLRKATNN